MAGCSPTTTLREPGVATPALPTHHLAGHQLVLAGPGLGNAAMPTGVRREIDRLLAAGLDGLRAVRDRRHPAADPDVPRHATGTAGDALVATRGQLPGDACVVDPRLRALPRPVRAGLLSRPSVTTPASRPRPLPWQERLQPRSRRPRTCITRRDSPCPVSRQPACPSRDAHARGCRTASRCAARRCRCARRSPPVRRR